MVCPLNMEVSHVVDKQQHGSVEGGFRERVRMPQMLRESKVLSKACLEWREE